MSMERCGKPKGRSGKEDNNDILENAEGNGETHTRRSLGGASGLLVSTSQLLGGANQPREREREGEMGELGACFMGDASATLGGASFAGGFGVASGAGREGIGDARCGVGGAFGVGSGVDGSAGSLVDGAKGLGSGAEEQGVDAEAEGKWAMPAQLP
ncbi:unnamed protein product [Ilex paraguariensis]|uniref:Uncharacterized protein n=1 Tax=Ilex paraguariensis TaxID=185542 RepID=A0ABC8TLA8_9AQUA